MKNTVQKFTPKYSSTILNSTYNQYSRILQVVFVNRNGDTATYNYNDISQKQFDTFKNADKEDKSDSCTKYLNRAVKPTHTYELVLGYGE